MKELRFRCWDKKNKRMYQGIDFWDIATCTDMGYPVKIDWPDVTGCSTGDISSDDIILMQYTGLKDKNGKEIYEGDIIKQKGCSICDCEPHILEAKYDKFYHYKGQGIGFVFWEVEEKFLEVIGNIYENPEKLK